MRRIASCALSLPLSLALAAMPGAAQAPSETPAAQQPAPLRSETHAILISVSVRDSKGGNISDLRQEDFRVTDNGKPRDVQLFPTDDAPAATVERPNVMPTGTFSNRYSPSVPEMRRTVILLDSINTPQPDQAFAREQAIKVIHTLKPGSPIAVYAMAPNLNVLQDYTTDTDALVAAVKSFRPRPPLWPLTAAELSASPIAAEHASIHEDAPSAGSRNMSRNMADFYLRQRIQTTAASLLAIATHMSEPAHRNSVIWITGGFVGNIETNGDVQRAIAAVNDANVALFPVDARGLLPRGIDANVQVMRGIAEMTGGEAYTLRNDVGQSIVEAIADTAHTYLLGFYLADGDLDGKFHKLHVTVNRPGLTLNYRSGYTAAIDPNARRENAEPIETEILSARDSSAIGIDAGITNVTDATGKSLRVQLTLDRNSFFGKDATPGSKVQLDELFAEYDAHGRVVAKVTETLHFEMPPADHPLAYSQVIRHQDGATKLRVVLQDKTTARTGSLTIPLTD